MTTRPPDTASIAIRQARREDVARIAALIMHGAAKQTMTEAEIEAEAAHPGYDEAFAAVLASPDNTLFVAEQAGTVVGTFQITIIPGLVSRGRKRAKIESVHVAPERRGQGIGAVMMRHAVAFARDNGVGLVELTSNKDRVDAHRFYRNFGFAQSHEASSWSCETGLERSRIHVHVMARLHDSAAPPLSQGRQAAYTSDPIVCTVTGSSHAHQPDQAD